MFFRLGDKYQIKVLSYRHFLKVFIHYRDSEIGVVQFVTDYTDVGCITDIQIYPVHIDCVISDPLSLLKPLMQFFLDFPYTTNQKLRFIFSLSENLAVMTRNDIFLLQKESDMADHFMVRISKTIAEHTYIPESVKLLDFASNEHLAQIHELLRKHTNWQSQLTIERLTSLVQSSQCFIASQEDQIIGFARVLTDRQSFASLWDVVVTESHRRQGIGQAILNHIFSNPAFCKIENWLLYTNTMYNLYYKFGFSFFQDVPDNNFIRIRDPDGLYMEFQ